jgi:hypothetical protein
MKKKPDHPQLKAPRALEKALSRVAVKAERAGTGSVIPPKTRLRYARGFLALGLLDEARAEIHLIADEVEKLPPDAILLLCGINERETQTVAARQF